MCSKITALLCSLQDLLTTQVEQVWKFSLSDSPPESLIGCCRLWALHVSSTVWVPQLVWLISCEVLYWDELKVFWDGFDSPFLALPSLYQWPTVLPLSAYLIWVDGCDSTQSWEATALSCHDTSHNIPVGFHTQGTLIESFPPQSDMRWSMRAKQNGRVSGWHSCSERLLLYFHKYLKFKVQICTICHFLSQCEFDLLLSQKITG